MDAQNVLTLKQSISDRKTTPRRIQTRWKISSLGRERNSQDNLHTAHQPITAPLQELLPVGTICLSHQHQEAIYNGKTTWREKVTESQSGRTNRNSEWTKALLPISSQIKLCDVDDTLQSAPGLGTRYDHRGAADGCIWESACEPIRDEITTNLIVNNTFLTALLLF